MNAEAIDVTLPTPNLANAASTAKFLDSEFKFNVIASTTPKLAATPVMAAALADATTTLNPWKYLNDGDPKINTGTYGATYPLTDGSTLDFANYVLTGKEFLDSVTDDPNTIAKTPVLKKGIFGTVKWYIGTDGVLHLSGGTMGETSRTIFPNNESPWNQYHTLFTKIKIEGDISIKSGYYLFGKLSELTQIDGLAYLSFTGVKDLTGMFQGTKNLMEVAGTSKWNLSSVITTSAMFYGSGIKYLDASDWNFGNATSFASMFNSASNLTTVVGTEKWDTKNVTNMVYMFNGASSLTTLDVSTWDTSNVGVKNLETDATKPARYGSMSAMFKNTSQLESLTLGNAKDATAKSWNTSNVANMTDMFLGMNKLSVITFGKNFNTAKLTTKSVALPNTSTTVKWKNVGEGTLSIPRGTESLTAYAGKVSDTYVLVATDRVGIDVTVQDSLGNPLTNVEVTLYKEDGSTVATIKTNSEGKASFSPQPYGKYSVKQITDLTNFSEPAAEQIELSSTTTGFKKVTLINNFKQMLPSTGSATRLWVVVIASLMIISSAAVLVVRVK